MIPKHMKKYLHDWDAKYCFENICHHFLDFINYIYCGIYRNYILHKKVNKIFQEPDWSFVLFWNLKSLYFTWSHLFSFVAPLVFIGCLLLLFFITPCHSLSFVSTRCTNRCHSMYHSLPFVAIRSHSMYHSSVYL